MVAFRGALDHIMQGGILLLFAAGVIEPDPSTDTIGDDEFSKWSCSPEVILRKVPDLTVIPTITSHVLLKRFRDSLLAKLRKPGLDRLRLAEFIQILQQLVFPKSVEANAKISFGQPFTFDDLKPEKGSRRVMSAAISRIKEEIKGHLTWVKQRQTDEEG